MSLKVCPAAPCRYSVCEHSSSPTALAGSPQQQHVLITARPSCLLLGVLTIQPRDGEQFEQRYHSVLRFVRIDRREVLLAKNLFFRMNPKQLLVFVCKE